MENQAIKNKIIPILKRQGATKAAIFGSFARGEENKNSDLDLLVEFKKSKSLLEMIRIQFEIEKKIGRKVDLLTYNGINHRLKDIILKEQKVIYEKRN
ncbi:MAG: nucleotidyltransferase family protein [Candidatus Pacebacteria bacterium]|nr:nucleotidyltransferase family protein [Candidatus Paceibacterota bacterium]